MTKYSKDKIQKAILRVYKDQKALADAMDCSESALANRIKRGSARFVRELETKYGVNVLSEDEDDRITKLEKKLEKKDELIDTLVGQVQFLKSEVERLNEENNELRVGVAAGIVKRNKKIKR